MVKPVAGQLWLYKLPDGMIATLKVVDVKVEKTNKGKKTWVGVRYFDIAKGKGFEDSIYDIRLKQFLENGKLKETEEEETEEEENGSVRQSQKRRTAGKGRR